MNAKLNSLLNTIKEKQHDPELMNEDLDSVLDLIKSYCEYSNSVVMESYRLKLAEFRANDPEQLRDARESIDRERRALHNKACSATLIVNKTCDMYEVERFYAGTIELDGNSDFTSESRYCLADFIGGFVYDEFNKGINALEIDVSDDNVQKNVVSQSEIDRKAKEYDLER